MEKDLGRFHILFFISTVLLRYVKFGRSSLDAPLTIIFNSPFVVEGLSQVAMCYANCEEIGKQV